MTRTPLDLRDKSMTELMEMDKQVSTELDIIDFVSSDWDQDKFDALIADRRQIRARMEEMRNELHPARSS